MKTSKFYSEKSILKRI